MKPLPPSRSFIIYDGDCPFCSRYVRFMRLRESIGPVELIDARSDHADAALARAAGFDLDDGMIFAFGSRYYHGADAVQMLSLLSSDSGWFNRVNALLFRSPTRSRWIYPVLRLGRGASLRLLGRSRISSS
jgi:predicted DCC family thiol-disulfide oxidoreductase YuxK